MDQWQLALVHDYVTPRSGIARTEISSISVIYDIAYLATRGRNSGDDLQQFPAPYTSRQKTDFLRKCRGGTKSLAYAPIDAAYRNRKSELFTTDQSKKAYHRSQLQ